MSDTLTLLFDETHPNAFLERTKLLRKKIASLFGYYPWSSETTNCILPPGVRYVGPLNTVAVIEVPPTYQRASYVLFEEDEYNEETDEYIDRREKFMYEIFVPWQVYVTSIHEGFNFMFFRKQPLQSLDEPVFVAPLPNQYASAQYCLNYSLLEPNALSNGMRMMNMFWAAGFNDELSDILYRYARIDDIKDRGNLFNSLMDADLDDYFSHWEQQSPQEILNTRWLTYDELHASEKYHPYSSYDFPCGFRTLRDWVTNIESLIIHTIPWGLRSAYGSNLSIYNISSSYEANPVPTA